MDAFANFNSTWVLLAGMAVLTSVMVRLTYRRLRRVKGPGAAGRGARSPSPSPAALSPSYRDLLARLEAKEAELDELSREALARLDNKLIVLQRLLAESEAMIARLDAAKLASQDADRIRSVSSL